MSDIPIAAARFFEIMWRRFIVDSACDGDDLQEALIAAAVVERKAVDPDTNEWGADWLYVLNDTGRAILAAAKGDAP